MKKDKFGVIIFILIVIFLLLAANAIRAQIPEKTQQNASQLISGESFVISKTVIAGGGAAAQSQTGQEIQATAGQAIAGRLSTGGQFSITSGFWTPDDFAPTAATVSVSGRVTTAQGNGIRNARVTILFPSGELRSTLTGPFGFYRFDAIEVGETYIFTISSKRFVFSAESQIFTINEDRDDINFIAVEK